MYDLEHDLAWRNRIRVRRHGTNPTLLSACAVDDRDRHVRGKGPVKVRRSVSCRGRVGEHSERPLYTSSLFEVSVALTSFS